MAGHSKWANIQHRKGAQDAKRGKIFTKLIREITIAARVGGGDTSCNPRLRLAIDKARAQSMAKDKIDRAIARGSGADGVENYEDVRYEGYGPGGVAILVDCLTDNRNRTVAEVRFVFSKYGGNLGANGSVAYLFNHVGMLYFSSAANEEKILNVALEAGAEDVISHSDSSEGGVEVLTEPSEFERVRDAMSTAQLEPELAEVTMRAATSIALTPHDSERLMILLEQLEELDDVQRVYCNAEFVESNVPEARVS